MKYTIKKGNHYSNFTINRLFPFCGEEIEGRVKFSKECLVPETIPGWNKAVGISSLKIHENSGRFVWRADGDKIKIAGYVYKDGVRSEIEICRLPVDKWFDYSVSFRELSNSWVFKINGYVILMDGKLGFWKMRCYPFFGGQSPAPVGMDIWV